MEVLEMMVLITVHRKRSLSTLDEDTAHIFYACNLLRSKGLMELNSLLLTDKGRERVNKLLELYKSVQ